MRSFLALLVVAVAPNLALAQTEPARVPDSMPDTSSLSDEVKELQSQVANQQQQLADQAKELQELRRILSAQPMAASANVDGRARLVDATWTTPTTAAPTSAPASAAPEQVASTDSPISFRIGGADFTPGGFLDFTSIFRTTNEGTLGTNFFSIPFNNQAAGHLTESRFTAQNSRISLKAHGKFGANDVTAYYELDFLGNDAANVEVTSNSHTLRQRLYWVDVKHGKWEILGGQTWGFLTPDRVDMSPMTSDVFFSLNEDFNYQVGLTWTRAPEFRVIYHPDDHWAFGVAAENPEQFGGQEEITYPAAFSSQLAGQIDSAAGGTSIPNLHPDIIPKVAYDTDLSGKHFHAELAGLLSGFKITDLSAGTYLKHSKEGGGVEYAVNYEFLKNIRFVSNGFYSDGGGRYIFGMGPDLVVLPDAAGTDVRIGLVHSASGIAGFEAQVTPRSMFFGYYGNAYFQRNFAPDTTAGAAPNALVGFGWPGSSSNNNRDIQEPTLGAIRTFWKNTQYGALQFISQVSYLSRDPWYVATAAPKNAHLAMVWLDLRYVVP